MELVVIERGKHMRSKKQWIITGAAALLLAMGGATVFVASEAAPMTHEETLKRTEEKFGKPPAMPTTAPVPQEKPEGARAIPKPTGEGFKETLEQSAEQRDWQKAELEKQQAAFAQHAPSPMPTGHDSTVVAGNKP